jgi:FeS assembly SUF system regulator
MLKLTKKADYGLIALRHLADAGQIAASAKDIADAYHVPHEAMAKILQKLAKAGLVQSRHGMNGGYVLARDARQISALEVIVAIDGPLLLTSCSHEDTQCEQGEVCNVREPLRMVSESIRDVLSRLSIWDMRSVPGAESEAHAHELVTLRV